ncbi:hypothetical protein [Actinoallomurus iriomotensis]|uniref:hypothetical protein n=1 Tax=Actinoallomurus iriomotensis TaxID=478107 RepID=UPI002553919C|nr:hypothetical protein [Actinoallomurus iriomotensis]
MTYVNPGTGPDAHRMVHRQIKRIDDKTEAVLVPVFDGLLWCIERTISVSVDPRTRTIGNEIQDESFILCYQDNDGNPPRQTTVRDSELIDNRNLNWMTRLGLSTIVRAKKHPAVRDLVRAVVFNSRGKNGRVVRVIDRSGPVYVDGVLCYANATGYTDKDGKRLDGVGAVFSPSGRLESVRCEPSSETDHHREVEYPVSLPKTKAAQVRALDALSALLSAYDDPGLTGVLVGQLLAAPLTGAILRGSLSVCSVSALIGPSRAGKTAFDMLLFTSQTRSLYGEVAPAISARCSAPNGSAGTTPAGIYQWLSPFGGSRSLLDDGMKEAWTEVHKRKALDTIYERVTSFIVGGGVAQAQGNNGKTEAAKTKRLYLSACISAECVGPVANMLEDSTYNRIAVVWWEKEKRCDRVTYDELKSREATLARNDGMRVVLDTLLRSPDVLADGYEIALAALREAGLDERVSKNYAKCLSGLHALDVAYAERRRKSAALAKAIPAAIEIAKSLESFGTHGGDQRALSDIAEATREGLAVMLEMDRSAYVAAAPDPQDVKAGIPLIPQEPTCVPFGFDLTNCGWSAGSDGTWKRRESAISAGMLIESLPGVAQNRGHSFAYRLQMKAREFAALHDRLNYVSGQRGFRVCSRQERIDALVSIGALQTSRRSGTTFYHLDFLWVLGTTYEAVALARHAESESDNG